MATLSITIPDAIMTRVVDALAANGGWTAESELTKAQFARQQLIAYVTNITRNHEATAAGRAAQQTAHDAAERDITIT